MIRVVSFSTNFKLSPFLLGESSHQSILRSTIRQHDPKACERNGCCKFVNGQKGIAQHEAGGAQHEPKSARLLVAKVQGRKHHQADGAYVNGYRQL